MNGHPPHFDTYEADLLHGRAIAWSGVTIVLGVVLTMAISWPFYHHGFRADQPPLVQSPPFKFTHGPSYETSIAASWDQLEKSERAQRAYGRNGADASLHIPVEEAMRLAVERGLPQWPASPEKASGDWHAHYLKTRQERMSREYAR